MAKLTNRLLGRRPRVMRALASVAFLSMVTAGCDDQPLEGAKAAASSSANPGGLSARDAASVLARVGDRTITLGDFAAVLDNMDQFQRLKYQTKKGRQALLDEMIEAELLAQEAKKRGLDKKPEVRARIRQILREARLNKLYRSLPLPGAFTPAQIAEYYEKNKARFVEPERRRVAVIVVESKDKAGTLIKKLGDKPTADDWGNAFNRHSTTAPAAPNPNAAPGLLGDLGLVTPPGDQKGANAKIPDAVRRAVFELAEVGDVASKPVLADDKVYIVRLSGRSKGHTRSIAESERTIRVALLQDERRKREKELEAELRKRFPVRVDEKALKTVKLPGGVGDSK